MYYNQDAEPVEIDVPFGPKPHQKISIEWAEIGLRWMYEQRRSWFGEMMLAIHECPKPTTTRGRKAGE